MGGVVHWPERAVYTVPEIGQDHELHLFCPAPTEILAHAVTDGDGDIAAVTLSGVLFLLYRFGAEGTPRSGDWSAVPYKRREKAAVRGASADIARPGTGGEAAKLSVFVVDATTGLLCGLRRIALPPGMANRLNAAIRREDARPFRGDHANQREVVWARSPYPSAKAMLANAFVSFHLEVPIN
jgi:hypothetical protein